LFWVAPDERGWLCLIMLSATLCCVTSFLVVGIFSENNTSKSFYYSPGLMERFEAFLFFIAMILWPTAFLLLAIAYIGLVGVTTLIRICEFAKQAGD
jgi:archaetidylinositol phosphate synthase